MIEINGKQYNVITPITSIIPAQLITVNELIISGDFVQAKQTLLDIVPDEITITQEQIDKHIEMINAFLGIQ